MCWQNHHHHTLPKLFIQGMMNAQILWPEDCLRGMETVFLLARAGRRCFWWQLLPDCQILVMSPVWPPSYPTTFTTRGQAHLIDSKMLILTSSSNHFPLPATIASLPKSRQSDAIHSTSCQAGKATGMDSFAFSLQVQFQPYPQAGGGRGLQKGQIRREIKVKLNHTFQNGYKGSVLVWI